MKLESLLIACLIAIIVCLPFTNESSLRLFSLKLFFKTAEDFKIFIV